MRSSLRHGKRFASQLRKLARKYPSAVEEVALLSERLKQGDRPGKLYRRVGRRVFRERLGNPSGGRGKCGGFRVAYLETDESEVVLLAICAREDCRDLQESSIRRLLTDEGL